jgi:Fe-S-cluster-containing dehydrogenase component
VSKKGLLIDYAYCTGCHSCEIACKQENQHPPGRWGIKLTEMVFENDGRVSVDYLPIPTEQCNLCARRTQAGELPACVKHCQTRCMSYGEVSELAKVMEKGTRTALFVPS